MASSMMYNSIGYMGVVLYVCAYALLNAGKIDGNGNNYIILNMVAACLLIISLMNDFNGPSFTTQSIWIGLSLYGLYNNWMNSKAVTVAVATLEDGT
jgi:hypothetical protein